MKLYQHVLRLFEARALARGDGRTARLVKTLKRLELVNVHDGDSPD